MGSKRRIAGSAVRLRPLLAGALMTWASGATPAAAEGLFRPATVSEARVAQAAKSDQAQASPEPQALRKGLVAIDPYYFRSRLAPAGTEKLSNADRDALVARLPTELDVTLFPDVALRLRRSGDREGRSDGPTSFFWAGTAEGSRVCDAFISIERGELFGEIICADSRKEYRISHLTENIYEIVELQTVPDSPDNEASDEPTPKFSPSA